MHPNEHALTAARARALLAAQMPDLAPFPLRRIGAEGTDNVLFRLGNDLLLRFPRLPHAATQLDHIARFLPALAPALPLPLPLPLRLGTPGPGYPFPWAVTPFLPGRPAPPGTSDPAAARALAALLLALQAQPLPPDAPRREGDATPLRLSALEAFIPRVTETAPARLFALLDRLRQLPPPAEAPVWTHGDLHPLNLLVRRGTLTGVIDWGTLAAGDPAMDLLPAFMVFDGPARAAFLTAMAPSDPALARARAVALSKLVHGLPYYRRSNPGFYAVLLASLPRVLAAP
jgi:aminoglycoside phosphotransferase (APT) family kinase protein